MNSLICYGIVLIGSISIAIVVYILSILGYHIWLSHRQSTIPVGERSHGPLAPCLVSSFKYEKGTENADATIATECAVCLSGFEDEEYLRQLPRCKHSFHAPCIDMWFHSHSDCPLCRAPVDRLDSLSHGGESTKGESSRDVLLEISISP